MRFEYALIEMRKGKAVRRPCWHKDTAIVIKYDDIYYRQTDELAEISCQMLQDDWEIAPSEHIVENKEVVTEDMVGYLCLFWDDHEESAVYGILEKISSNKERGLYPYYACIQKYTVNFKHCRPVEPDEIRIYDDYREKSYEESVRLRLELCQLKLKLEKMNEKN